MEYYVSHRVNYEPSGHKDFPDKYFNTFEHLRDSQTFCRGSYNGQTAHNLHDVIQCNS